MSLGKRSPITRKHGWFAGEDQTFQWKITGTTEDIATWTFEFRLALESGVAHFYSFPVIVTNATKRLVQGFAAADDTVDIPGDVTYWYQMWRTDPGSERVEAYGPAFLGARVA